MTFIAVFFIAGILFMFFMMFAYNLLVQYTNRVDESWSDVDIQLQRRYDMIPNLVNIVSGYAEHEMELFRKVTNARADAVEAEVMQDPKDVTAKDNILSSTLKTLFAVAEAYPDLKANQNFLELQKELADTENKIQSARRFYNNTVKDYNTKIQIIPINLVARMLRFNKRDFFELGDESVRENVKIDFNK
jgi:LemA protein